MAFSASLFGVLAIQLESGLVVVKLGHAKIRNAATVEAMTNGTIGQGHVTKFVRVVMAGRAFTTKAKINSQPRLLALALMTILAGLESMRALKWPAGQAVVKLTATAKRFPIDGRAARFF